MSGRILTTRYIPRMSEAAGAQSDVATTNANDDGLLLDRIDALKVLRANTPEEKGALLEQIAGPGKAEQDIVRELSKLKPLWRPDRFEESHRWVMRALEVLDRNGTRGPAFRRSLGPLKPIAGYVVGLLIRWIVRGYQNGLVTKVRKLYERREANSIWGSDEHVMIRRARINALQVEQGFKGKQLGLPSFLLGGAILSSIFSGIASAFSALFNSDNAVAAVIVLALFVLMLLGLAWSALYAAAVARRRIRLCTDQPVKALWETIGACGNPPKDESYNFAVYALILTAVAAVAIPLVMANLFVG
jgi:hypothetical protein